MSDKESRLLGFIITFDILNILALITLSAVLVTAWYSPRIRRVPTWYLYILSWDVYSLSYLLIIGKQTGSEPVWGWCLFQAVMIYATPVLTAASVVVFVTQIYLDIRFALGFKIPKVDIISKLMLVPWIFFITIICEVLIIGLSSPNSVDRSPSGMFCRINISFPNQVTGITVILCTVLVALLGVSIAITIHRNREPWQGLIGSREFQSYDVVFRVAVFFLPPVIAIGLLVIKFLPQSRDSYMGGINIIYAILPALAGIVSASQKDIWHIWIFWRSSVTDSTLTEDKERQLECIIEESIVIEVDNS